MTRHVRWQLRRVDGQLYRQLGGRIDGQLYRQLGRQFGGKLRGHLDERADQ